MNKQMNLNMLLLKFLQESIWEFASCEARSRMKRAVIQVVSAFIEELMNADPLAAPLRELLKKCISSPEEALLLLPDQGESTLVLFEGEGEVRAFGNWGITQTLLPKKGFGHLLVKGLTVYHYNVVVDREKLSKVLGQSLTWVDLDDGAVKVEISGLDVASNCPSHLPVLDQGIEVEIEDADFGFDCSYLQSVPDLAIDVSGDSPDLTSLIREVEGELGEGFKLKNPSTLEAALDAIRELNATSDAAEAEGLYLYVWLKFPSQAARGLCLGEG